MGTRDYTTSGGSKTYNVYCHRCGLKRKYDECIIEQDLMGKGFLVCRDTCFDGEHPQDFVTGVPDDMTVPYPSPFDGSQDSSPADPPFDPITDPLI